MTEQKKQIEIECPACKIRFRVWIPEAVFSQWKDREEIGCIKCRANIKIERDNDSFRVISEQLLTETGEQTPYTATPTAADGENVLVVDDDAVIRKMAEEKLKKEGFAPSLAKNGPEALRIVEKNPVSVVIVDLHLKNPKDPQSVMDGEEFLRRLADLGKKIPAIATTGKDLIDDIILEPKWYDLMVKAFIQKGSPFWIDELLTKLKEILKKD